MPTILEDLRELRDLYEKLAATAVFERVQTDRPLLVSRFDDDELAAQILVGCFFLRGNRS